MGHLSTTESRIIRALLKEASRKGYLVSVHDGEDWTVQRTADMKAAFAAIGTTESTTLMFRQLTGPEHLTAERMGTIYLVHGNDEDVIADCTDNTEMLHLCAVATGEAQA